MYRKDKKDEFYTRKAKEEGYPARSVYKLKEIDEKYKIFKKGDRVLDLGCAPGSWLKYISEKIGDSERIVGVDSVGLKIPLARNMIFIQKSIFDLTVADIGSQKFQSVVSDLSPSTTGIKLTDEARSLEFCEKTLELAIEFLQPGGDFVCKIFEGELSNEFFKEVERNFKFVKRFRPKAVNKKSREIYVIGKEFIL